jgi:SAM-dependent methyltransferase
MKPLAEIQADFDDIAEALAEAGPRELLTAAESALLRHVPPHARRALDVGCGDGVLTRAVARRGISVLGIDISPGMIALARARTEPGVDIEYRVADVMTETLPPQTFDVVMTVSMLHHVPLEAIVPRLADAVAPAGVLLIQDVLTRRGIRALPTNAVAWFATRLRRLVAPPRITPRVAALYDAHGRGERYLTPVEAVSAYRALLPTARVEHHLQWRYSVIWHRT